APRGWQDRRGRRAARVRPCRSPSRLRCASRNQPAQDPLILRQAQDERVPGGAARSPPAHGELVEPWAGHGRVNSPLLPPTLCSSSTLPMLIARSTALHMSYTVKAATAAAVSASISTPVRLVTRTVA